jgi:hypothetical protein
MVRARWESTLHHRGDDSPTIPLLQNNVSESKSTPKMDQSKAQHPILGSSRRLTSGIGGMWNKSVNTVRNKAFSRASRHVSSEMSDDAGHTRQSGSIQSIGHSSTNMGKKNDKMVRSKTTSFLPVPTKVSALCCCLEEDLEENLKELMIVYRRQLVYHHHLQFLQKCLQTMPKLCQKRVFLPPHRV